ncbi:MAG: DUF5020 family protein [Paludibacteraceae bacterium]
MFLQSQNLQVHYDFGKGRNFITTTFEMFKPDKWGNTFIFIDFDYNLGNKNHPALAYTEIARCFSLGKSPLSAQIEYNGGLLMNNTQQANFSYPGYPINNAYLTGLDYGWHSDDFTKFVNFKVLYKYIADKNPTSFQITGVWDLNFFKKKLTFSGFADFWREDNTNFYNAKGESLSKPVDTKFIFLTEPQIWYNVTPNISLGSEWELGVNFGTVHGLKVCPTLGAKWTF